MPRTKECSCDRRIFNSNAIEFVINGSRIELQCHRCDGLVRWWNEDGGMKILKRSHPLDAHGP